MTISAGSIYFISSPSQRLTILAVILSKVTFSSLPSINYIISILNSNKERKKKLIMHSKMKELWL